MDLLNTDKIFFNNKEHVMAYFNEKLVWTNAKGEFSKDFKDLTENDDFDGFFDGTKLTVLGSGKSVLYFNGVNPAITILNTNNRLQPGNQFTWEMWFKLESYTQYNTLMGFSSNDMDFGRMDSTTGFQNHTWDSNGNQTFVTPSGFPSVNDGKWHHYAIVWDGVNGYRWGYLDGVQRYYATHAPGTQIKSTERHGSFTIGGANTTGRLIKGWIREVRMWQKARTQQEILDDMRNSLTGNEVGLFLYLPLNEGQGNVLVDKASGFETNLNSTTWDKKEEEFFE